MECSEQKAVGEMKVEVLVKQAKGLQAKDSGGTSDPYAIVSAGKQSFKTPVVKKTLSPVWNHTQQLGVPAGIKSLKIEIYDHGEVN